MDGTFRMNNVTMLIKTSTAQGTRKSALGMKMAVCGFLGVRLFMIYMAGRKSGFRKPLTQLDEE